MAAGCWLRITRRTPLAIDANGWMDGWMDSEKTRIDRRW
nr:unnamed protein product [Digitaria exilis]